MGVNDSNPTDAAEACDSIQEYSNDRAPFGRVGDLTNTASCILASMKADVCSRPTSPSFLPHSTIPPPSTILLSLREDKSCNNSPYTVSPPSSPPSSPIPKTSSILMSLKNDMSHALNSSTSSMYNSPSPPLSRSGTPSPPVTPSSTPPPSPNYSPSPSPSFSSSSSGLFGAISPPSSPPSSATCFVPNCLVCTRGPPVSVLKTPTWSSIMRVVFYALQTGFPSKLFFNLRTDVYVFMANHWDKLCPSKDASHNWKKQIQDMLSHSKNMFESGTGVYKQNGFWRLKKPLMDPWYAGKATFHHRAHHRATKTTRIGHFDSHGDEPPGKRFRETSDLDFHVPALSENKSLVSAFKGLKTEMALMREQMQIIISHRDGLCLRSSASSLLPTTVFCPTQPLDMSYNWDRVGSIGHVSSNRPPSYHHRYRHTALAFV